jgi:hypothetical protein
MQPEPGARADELVEWAEVLGGDMLGGSGNGKGRSDFKPVEEVLSDLAARLNHVVRRALEQAGGSPAAFAPTQLLWAPGRVRVCFHDGWHETEIDGTLESLEAAVFSATYSAVEASRDY